MTIGIIIAGITLLVFISFIIYVLWARNTPDYPKGARARMEDNGYKLDVITDNRLVGSYPKFQVRCFEAVQSIVRAWPNPKYAKGKLKHTVIWFVSDAEFKPRGVNPDKAAACIDRCLMKFGSKFYPMPVIKNSFVDQVYKTGEPLIHELCHAILDEYQIDLKGSHYQTDIWSKFDEGQAIKTAQTTARLYFKNNTKHDLDRWYDVKYYD